MQAQNVCHNAVDVIGFEDLVSVLARDIKPIVKAGFDPTSPDLHLGHWVLFRKLRELELMGCQINLVVGDFTAAIGDPTGRNAARPPLTKEEIEINSASFVNIMRALLKTPIITYNSAWFQHMKMEDSIRLQSQYTLSQMLSRKDFLARFNAEKPIHLHEMMYPLLQGHDSCVLRANIELGGIDQKFNLLVGRELQRAHGQDPQTCILMPLLMGLDGEKMSKSAGNHIGLLETPDNQFARLMAVPDGLVEEYRRLLSPKWRPRLMDMEGPSPFEFKKQVAVEILTAIHSAHVAEHAQEHWISQFSKREQPESMPIVTMERSRMGTLAEMVFQTGLASSKSEAARKIKEGAVYFGGTKSTNPHARMSTTADEFTLKLGRNWRHVIIENS